MFKRVSENKRCSMVRLKFMSAIACAILIWTGNCERLWSGSPRLAQTSWLIRRLLIIAHLEECESNENWFTHADVKHKPFYV